MFIHILMWVFEFCLLLELTYSFRTFKHDITFYYKTQGSVFLTNPFNHTTSYGIYVAGQTITVDIPTSVVKVSDILDWKVVNLNKDRLMFVHKKRPQILINRKTIKKMKYSGELSDSIIPFGDNEALHVPTISNPKLTKPVSNWNYIELLYFDDQSETVSVIRSLPWARHNDWKDIKEWKMMDYIHFDDKLYLAMKMQRQSRSTFQQFISIVQMCLDQGSELISSIVEINFTRPEFITNQINDLIFVFIFGPLGYEKDRYQLHTTQTQPPYNTKIYEIYSIGDFVSLFDKIVDEKCASGPGYSSLPRSHSRSQVKCKKAHAICPETINNFLEKNVSDKVTKLENVLDTIMYSVANELHKLEFFTLPYPYYTATLMMHTKPIFSTMVCEYNSFAPLECKNYGNSIGSDQKFSQADFHVNKHPYGVVYETQETNQSIFGYTEICKKLKTCTECIMYGFYSDCIWSTSICTRDDQPKNKASLTVDHCFKIIAISSLIFNSSSPTKLTIELDRPLNITASQEHLVVQAGYNRCTNITMSGSSINCSMRLTKSGEFKIDVSLRNDRYADAAIISAVSKDKVHVFIPDKEFDSTFIVIFVLFLLITLVISSFILIAYKKCNKKYANRSKKFSRAREVMGLHGAQSAITRVRSKILSSTMNTITDSTFTNAASSKRVSRWSSTRFVPDHLYLSKQLYSSKLK